jgi:hypothetical protein
MPAHGRQVETYCAGKADVGIVNRLRRCWLVRGAISVLLARSDVSLELPEHVQVRARPEQVEHAPTLRFVAVGEPPARKPSRGGPKPADA